MKVVPKNNVGAVSYSIAPALPEGLVLTQGGSISGQALAVSPSATYTITATDGAGGALGTASMTITIVVEPRIPLAVSGVTTFAFEQYGSSREVRLSPAADVTVFGNAVWNPTTALPAWLTVTNDGNDIILSWEPQAIDTTGVDVGFTLADQYGASPEHRVHLTVSPPVGGEIALPATVPGTVILLSNYSADVAAGTTFTKVDHQDVTWSLVLDQDGDALPPGLELKADGTIEGQPLALGTFHFGIQAAGPNGVTGSARYAITVSAPVMDRVASSSQSSCVALSTGQVKCWGSNSYGLLGNNSQLAMSAEPVIATELSGSFVDIAGGYSGHMCGLKNDGTVWCWGLGTNGQPGNGSSWTSAVPVRVKDLTDVVSIVGGYKHTCATKSNGSMWCWGQAGTVGDGSNVNKNSPQQVAGMESGVIGMAAGSGYSCATKSDGTAWCWGSNTNGRLGDGTTTNSYVPVRVKGLTNPIAMIGGYDHTCATKADRTVWCWGSALNGQLGIGSNITSGDYLEPVKVEGLDSVSTLSTGDHHNCAVKLDRTAWCWGKNNQGQLGNGTTTQSGIPVQVQGMEGVTSISAIGYTHTCATKTDGSAWCWGENNYGQLGNNNLGTRSNVPVRVSGF